MARLMQICRWHSLPEIPTLQSAVLQRIAECAIAAIAARGCFHIVLAGGRTPQAIYTQLRTLTTDWRAWSIYFGDERCLPIGDSERNDTMARTTWLDHVAIPDTQIYSIPAQLGPLVGSERYVTALANVGDFDLVLLGLGEDGHTASLFPGDTSALQAERTVLPVVNAPKPPPQRISMSAARLSRAGSVLFLVVGADKQDALSRWRHGELIPASCIKPANGVDIYTDRPLVPTAS